MNVLIRTTMALSLTTLAWTAQAAEVAGVELPDDWTVNDTTLTLNGAGVREYGWFGIDGYVAGLYLQQPSSDADAILDSDGFKVVHLQYKRGGGDVDDARAAWEKYLRANCEAMACEWPADAAQRFLGWVAPAREGATETVVFMPDGTHYSVDGQRRGTITDATFARILLASWIGPKPSTEALRRVLLGDR